MTMVWNPFLLFCASLVLLLTAFLCPWWIASDHASEGLWMKCEHGSLHQPEEWSCTWNLADEVRAVQVLMSLAVFCCLCALSVHIRTLRDENHDIRAASMLGFAAVILELSGLVIYGLLMLRHSLSSPLSISWCFPVAGVSCFLMLVNNVAICYFTKRPTGPSYRKIATIISSNHL